MNSIILLAIFSLVPMVYGSTGRRVMVGGWSQVPNHDPEVQEVSRYATNAISERSNSLYHKRLIHVHEVQSQVVSGIKYNITMDVGTTECPKNVVVPQTLESCSVRDDHMVERCLATVWDRPWLKQRQLLHFECKPHMSYHEYFSELNLAQDQTQHPNPEGATAGDGQVISDPQVPAPSDQQQQPNEVKRAM